MNEGLFNTGAALWSNARESYRERRIKIIIADGHAFAGSDGCVARFASDEEADKVLTEAGYVRDVVLENNVYEPAPVKGGGK